MTKKNSYRQAKAPFELLTGAEYRVLELLAEGGNSSTIGKTMNIGKNTVRNSLSRIYLKLGINKENGSKSGKLIAMYYG